MARRAHRGAPDGVTAATTVDTRITVEATTTDADTTDADTTVRVQERRILPTGLRIPIGPATTTTAGATTTDDAATATTAVIPATARATTTTTAGSTTTTDAAATNTTDAAATTTTDVSATATTAARTARGRGSGTLAAAGGCTRGVREKGYTAASRRNGTEALARSRCRSGRCREQRPVLSDYS